MEAWGVDDVVAWLASLELEGHCSAFRSSAIDGPLLVDLTEGDLHQLGVTNKFHVRKILQRRDKVLAGGGGEVHVSPKLQVWTPPHADAGLEHGGDHDSAEREQLHARLLRGKALGHGEGGGSREAHAAPGPHTGAASSPPFPGRLRPLAQPPSPPPLELPPSDAVLRPRSKNWRAEVVQAHAAARAPNRGAAAVSRFTASQEEVSDLMGLLQDAVGVGAPAPSHEAPGPRPVTLLPRSSGGRAPPTSPPPDPGAVNDASAALSALRRAGGAGREIEQALLALCSVARRSQGAAVAVLTTGAPPQVVAAVRDHGVEQTGVASAAASAMCALCGLPIGYLPSPGHIAELRDAPTGSALSLGLSTFAAAQAVPPLLACLTTHASNAPVAAAVLTALAVLAAGHSECAQQAAEASSGGLDALVVALYVHADVPAIQASGCTALAALLVARPNRRAAALAAGAAEVVQYATRRHGQHPAVQAAAQAAAAALGQERGAAGEVEEVHSSSIGGAAPAPQQQHVHSAAEATSYEPVFSVQPSPEATLAAEEPPAHVEQVFVADEAAVAPETMAPGEVVHSEAAAVNAAASSAALIDVLRSDAAAASPEEVTKVLLLLSSQWTSSASLSGESVSSADGGVGAVIAAMRAHGDSAHVIAAGLDCLAAAVSGAGESQRRVAARVVAAGGVALTAQALRRHVADAALCTSACSVLTALAPECSDARDAGTAAVAAATAANRHSGDAALGAAAKRARYALSFTAANEAAAAAGVAAVAEALKGQKLASPAPPSPAVAPPAPQHAEQPVPAPQEHVIAASPAAAADARDGGSGLAPDDDPSAFEAFAVGIATGKAPGVRNTPVAMLLTQLLTGLRRHGSSSPVCALAACDALIALLSTSPAAGAVLWDATLEAAQIMTVALEHHVDTATAAGTKQAEDMRAALKAAAALTSALALFADEESATEQVLAAGVAPALVRCMGVQQRRGETLRAVPGGDVLTPLTQALTTAAATTACALCADGRAAAELADAGALQAAAAALQACAPASQRGGSPSNATLASALAGLVQALSASGEQCDEAGDSGVCEAVLACCPRGTPHAGPSYAEEVQLHCALAAALRNLTVSAPNRARVMAAGGPAAVVAFLTRASTAQGDSGASTPAGVLAEHTCGTLRNLACDAEAAQALVGAGAPVAAVKALKAHARRHDTAEVAAAALANLTAGSSEAAQHVADAGGVEALCASMGTGTGTPAKGELRSVCAFALANISACPGAHGALATQGGIAALVDALQTGTAPATVLAGALSNLAVTPAAVETAHRNGAAFALLHALRVSPDTASATACAAAVQALCASSAACAAACFAAGAAETLAACAKIHPEAAHACTAAAAAVKSAGNGAPPREASPSWTQAPEAAGTTPPPQSTAAPPLKSPDALMSSLVAAVSGGSASEVLSVLHTCSSSCPDDRARVALASAGGIAVACDALEWALTSLDEVQPGIAQTVAAAAAGLVANLASPAGSATSLAASDVAASLGAALAWRPRTPPNGACPALAAVLSAVAAASAGDPRNAQRLAAGKVGPRVVEVLQHLGPVCDDVAEAGCRAVRFLGPTALVDSPNTLRAALAAVTMCGQRHSTHNGVQYWADQALTALQAGPPGSPPPGSPPPEANQPTNAASTAASGQATAALVALAAAGGDARAAEAALAALMSAVAADPSQAGTLCAAGAVPAVIDALRACPRSSAVAMRGLGALAELCCDADTALQAATQGAVHAVVASMAHHRQSASVQQEGCRAMVRLCVSAKVASHVASGDMGAAVVAAVNDHIAHMGDQSWGRRLLTALDAIQNGKPPPPLDDSPPRSVGSGSGGSSATSTPPRKPPMAPTSPRNSQQSDGSAPKRAQPQQQQPQQQQQQPPLPPPPDQLSPAAQQAVASPSASTRDPVVDVENVIQALCSHMGDADVCEKGLAVMVTLAGQGPSFRAVLGASPAAEVVTDVLAQHPQHPGVARKACAALQAMCTPLGGRGTMPSEEDVACAIAVDAARPDAAIAASLRALSGTDAGAATAACKALAEVAVLSADAAVRAVSDGEALPAIMATLRVHAAAGQPLLAQAALEALAALAEPRTEAVLHSSGAADVVIHLMRIHVDSAAAITAGAHAIAALSGSPAGCVRVATAGGVLALLRAMRAWPTDQGVQAALLGALWNTTVTSDNQARTTAAGGTDLVTEALRRFGASSLPVAEAACGCIRNLACDPAAGQRLAGTGAVGAVLAALRVHGNGNAEFTSLAQAALGNLLASPAACVAVLKIQPDDSQAVALASRALVTAADPEEGVTAPHAAQTALRAAQGAGLTRDLVRALAQRHPAGGPGDNTSARRWVLQLLDVLQLTNA